MVDRPSVSPEQRAKQEQFSADFRARTKADVALIDAGSWSDATKAFAKRQLAGKKTGDLPERLDFIETYVPADVLAKGQADYTISRMMGARLSFLSSVREAMGQASWEEAMREVPNFGRDIADLAIAADVKFAKFKEGFYDGFGERAEVPIELEDDTPERRAEAADMRETLEETGFDAIAKAVASRMVVMTPLDQNDAHGVYDNQEATAGVWATGTKRFMLPPVLFHEVGHAFEKRVKSGANGQNWSDRYAASTYLRPETSSWYADSYIASEQGGRVSGKFLKETFAEDFRHYWIDQDHVAPERRVMLDGMMDELLPGLDRDEIRVRIRLFLRKKYDVGPEDVKEPTDCDRSKEAADKRIAEAALRRAEYLAAQAAKKTV